MVCFLCRGGDNNTLVVEFWRDAGVLWVELVVRGPEVTR